LRGKTAKKNFWIGVIVFPFRAWRRMMINNEERMRYDQRRRTLLRPVSGFLDSSTI